MQKEEGGERNERGRRKKGEREEKERSGVGGYQVERKGRGRV